MSFDYRIVIVMAVALTGAVYTVFLVPPLTTGGGAVIPGVREADLTAAIQNERAYCEERQDNVDCACFANKSGLVLAAKRQPVPGTQYMDQQDLARGQAASSC